MTVSVDGWHYATWKVSTAREGYWTPRGSFRVWGLKRMHYSRKYDNSPMPYSVFFKGGYAIHGTGSIRALGRPASHGCVRLHPSNAATLYGLVQEYGLGRTRIHISGGINKPARIGSRRRFLMPGTNTGPMRFRPG